MKKFLWQHFKSHTVIILLLLSVTALLFYVKYQQPSKSETAPVIDYKTVKIVDIVSDTLHLAQVSLFMEINNIPFNKATVFEGSPKLRNIPTEKLPFTSLQFIVPGEEGVNEALPSVTTPLNIREENVVMVYNIVPWTNTDYEKRSPAGRDMRVGWESFKAGHLLRKDPFVEFLGMDCYRDSLTKDGGFFHDCLVEIKEDEWAHVKVDDLVQEGIMTPMIRVHYFSKAYGGLTIRWQTHAKHAPKWKDIDAKLWQLLDERNVVVQKTP